MVKKSIFVGIFSITALAVSQGVLTFSVTFTAKPKVTSVPPSEQMFQEALDFWDDLIIDHRDGATRNFELTVDTFDSAPAVDLSLWAAPVLLSPTNPILSQMPTLRTNDSFLP